MSQQPNASEPQTLPSGAFLGRIIRFLMPFFIGTATDSDAAQADILETLTSYGARTRAEMLSAARVIAFSMATLETLCESNAGDLSPAMKLRHRSCASGLNRAAIQTEKALDQRLARAAPAPSDPAAEPLNDTTDAETQATIDHAKAAIQAHRASIARPRPPTNPMPMQQVQSQPAETNPNRNQQLWAGAMRDTLRQMGLSDATNGGG